MWEQLDADFEDEPHFTSQAALTYFLTSRNLSPDDLRANPVVLAAFQPRMHRRLVRLTEAQPAPHWVEPERAPLAHGHAAGRPVSVILLPIGAPWTVLLCEHLIAAGARAILATGAAGSLQEHAPIGTLVVPTGALREEGTSYHYAPPTVAATPSPDLVDALVAACRTHGVEPLRGLNWTTDGVLRETRAKVDRLRARGVLTVDMEASAMYILGQKRGVAVASLFIVSDELSHPWKPAFIDAEFLRRVALAADIVVDVAARLGNRE